MNEFPEEHIMVGTIRLHVACFGKQTNKAQSCWGMDRWEYKGVTVGLGDDGYTDYVSWGDRLSCHYTSGRKVVYSKGSKKDLAVLFVGLQKERKDIIRA